MKKNKARLVLSQKQLMIPVAAIAISTIFVFIASIIYFNIGTPKVAKAATSTSLSFKNPILKSGTLGALNNAHTFSNVTTGVDAIVTLTDLNNSSTLRNIDLGASTTGYDDAFQPQVRLSTGSASTPKTSFLEWKIEFKKAGTNTDTVLSMVSATAIDIDASSDYKEWIEAFNASSYGVYPSTSLTVTTTANSVIATAPTTGNIVIDSSAKDLMFQINWLNVSSITYRTGGVSKGSSGYQDRYFSIYFSSFFAASTALPVSLTKFEGKPIGNKVLLKWITASEHDNDYFTLERSNNYYDFKPLAKINGAGNSNQLREYEYIDEKPLSGSNYYRLRQTDFNGQFEIFKPIVVGLNSNYSKEDLLTIASANPFKELISINYNAPDDGEIQLVLINSGGSEVKRINQNISKGLNRLTFDNLDDLKPGVYFVIGNDNETKLNSIKVVKQ